MKVTHILPLLFQGFYAEGQYGLTRSNLVKQCSKAITGTYETWKEMNQAFDSRGFYNQDDLRVLEFMIDGYEDFMVEHIDGMFEAGILTPTSEEGPELIHEKLLCGFKFGYSDIIFIGIEDWFQTLWDFIKTYDLLDFEETKNLVLEMNKAFTAFMNFGHGNLCVDPRLRQAFRKVFGENTDIETRVETVYESFKAWQTFYSDEDSAEMLQVLLSAVIDELKPFVKALEEWTLVERDLRRMNRRRRSVSSEELWKDFDQYDDIYEDVSYNARGVQSYEDLAYRNYFKKVFKYEDVLEFVGDLSEESDTDLTTKTVDILESKNQRRFKDIGNSIRKKGAKLEAFVIQNCPMTYDSIYWNNHELVKALDDVQKIVDSSEFKNLLEAILKFPRAFWEEFDKDEWLLINKILLAKNYEQFYDSYDKYGYN